MAMPDTEVPDKMKVFHFDLVYEFIAMRSDGLRRLRDRIDGVWAARKFQEQYLIWAFSMEAETRAVAIPASALCCQGQLLKPLGK